MSTIKKERLSRILQRLRCVLLYRITIPLKRSWTDSDRGLESVRYICRLRDIRPEWMIWEWCEVGYNWYAKSAK